MYRLQVALVLLMAVTSMIGYLIVPAKNRATPVELEPASAMQSAQWPSRSAEFVLKQKELVRDRLLSNARAEKDQALTLLSETDNVAYGVVEKNKSYWIVILGEQCPSRFWPKASLRIWKSGQIDEQNSAGEWEPISR